jgi:hypothetical protein
VETGEIDSWHDLNLSKLSPRYGQNIVETGEIDSWHDWAQNNIEIPVLTWISPKLLGYAVRGMMME